MQMFPIMSSTKIALMVLLLQTKWPPELRLEKIFKQHLELLTQIQNNLTEVFLIVPSSKIVQTVTLS